MVNMTKRLRKGYSLIELTIVVGLISVLAITISSIVLTTIVNSNRIRNQIRLRQIGDFAVGQMQTMIRNARKVTSCDQTADTITIQNPDGQTTRFYLETTYIASNSGTFNITPSDSTVTNFTITCEPSATEPKLVTVSFTLSKTDNAGERAIEMQPQTYAFSVGLRNE